MTTERIARLSDQEVIAPSSLLDESILPTYPNIGTPKDVSEALGIPENSVRQLCRTHELRAFKCGTQWRIPKAWLLEFIDHGGSILRHKTSCKDGDLPWDI